jgi:hypothetical protein
MTQIYRGMGGKARTLTAPGIVILSEVEGSVVAFLTLQSFNNEGVFLDASLSSSAVNQ